MKKIILLIFIFLSGCMHEVDKKNEYVNTNFNSLEKSQRLYKIYHKFINNPTFYMEKHISNNRKYYKKISWVMNKNKTSSVLLKGEVSQKEIKKYKYIYTAFYNDGILVKIKNPNMKLILDNNQRIIIEQYKSDWNSVRFIFYNHKSKDYVSCNLQNKTCVLRNYTYKEDAYGKGSKNKNQTKKIFTTYEKVNMGQSVFYNKGHKINKIIDYDKMNIKYYFYENKKSYDVICNYVEKECRISFPRSIAGETVKRVKVVRDYERVHGTYAW